MLRHRLILILGLTIASAASAATTPRLVWETHVPAVNNIIWFVPDESGGVAIVTSDNASGASQLFWIDHTGRTIFTTSTPSQLYFVGVSGKGLAYLDPVSSRIIAVDAQGVATAISNPDELAPPFPLNPSPNFAKMYDTKGFFVQVAAAPDMLLRRYEW
jgi:hypothetical protein